MKDTSAATETPSQPLSQPDPPRDRSGHAVPQNIAQLLYVVRILLEYGRHLAATLERRAAAPGFVLFSRLFGTARLAVIHAHLHRGILRAAALETVLLKRAETGRDVEISKPAQSESAAQLLAGPEAEPLADQVARLLAQRAQYDTPVDPARLPGLEEIAAEVTRHPITRTIAAICRDLGLVAGLCTHAFWNALVLAMVCYQASDVNCRDDANPQPDMCPSDPPDDPAREPPDQGMNPRVHLHRVDDGADAARAEGKACPEPAESNSPATPNHRLQPCHRARGNVSGQTLKHCKALVYPFHTTAAPHPRRYDVLIIKRSAAPAETTGPPTCTAMKIAA